MNGETWQIVFYRTLTDKQTGQNLVGECDPSTMEIRIKLGQSRREAFLTLCHEAIHAAEFSYDFELDHAHVEFLEKAFGDIIDAL